MLRRTNINFVNETLIKNKNWKILDIGCGYSANKNATTVADVKDLSNYYKDKHFIQIQAKQQYTSVSDCHKLFLFRQIKC